MGVGGAKGLRGVFTGISLSFCWELGLIDANNASNSSFVIFRWFELDLGVIGSSFLAPSEVGGDISVSSLWNIFANWIIACLLVGDVIVGGYDFTLFAIMFVNSSKEFLM